MFESVKNNPYWHAIALALVTAVISGTNNFLTKIAVTAVRDPIVYTTLKNAIVAAFLIGVIIGLKKWKEIAALTKKQIMQLFLIGIVGGAVPFALFFTGLSKTSALNAGLIHKTLFIWVAVLAIPVLKERFSFNQWIGIGALFAANLAIGGFSGFRYNTGELMIFGATLLWATENIIAKIVLRDISSALVAGARMTIGSAFLALLVLWQGHATMISGLNTIQWGWTLMTSALLFGYVLCWYAALQRAPATYIAALLVPATLVTNALTAIFITHTMQSAQIANMALYAIGAALVIVFAKRTVKFAAQQQIFQRASV